MPPLLIEVFVSPIFRAALLITEQAVKVKVPEFLPPPKIPPQ
jgi:hypothetical protein